VGAGRTMTDGSVAASTPSDWHARSRPALVARARPSAPDPQPVRAVGPWAGETTLPCC